MKEKHIWLILFCLSILVSACSQQTGASSDTHELLDQADTDSIQEEINNLDPDDPKDAEILYGKEIFDNTQNVVPENVGNQQNCLSCHGSGGLEPNSPMVGVTSKYPTEHHGKPTSMEDRINGCFQRSMNGKPLDEDGEEMKAMVTYFEFISKDVDDEDDITWKMTNGRDETPVPDVEHGEELFDQKNCLSCHATDGSGDGPSTGPPIWGPGSFNESAGMNRYNKITDFIQTNMPKDQPGTLTDQEAADLAAYVLSHERPVVDPDELGDYHLSEDRDYMFQERREKIRDGSFDWTELDGVD